MTFSKQKRNLGIAAASITIILGLVLHYNPWRKGSPMGALNSTLKRLLANDWDSLQRDYPRGCEVFGRDGFREASD